MSVPAAPAPAQFHKRSPAPWEHPMHPSKRPKTDHDPGHCRASRASAAARRASPDHPSRPLTCSAQRELPLSRHLPQSAFSRSSPRYHNPVSHAADDAQQALRDSIAQLNPYATHTNGYISSPVPSSSDANPPPLLCSPGKSPPMNFSFPQHFQPSFCDPFSVYHNNGGACFASEAPTPGTGATDLLYSYDGTDFAQPETWSSCHPYDLSLPIMSFGSGMTELSSPSCRSLSRSSLSSATDTFSPCTSDYPTPVSDSTVTTPSPAEACDPLSACTFFDQGFSFGLDEKTKGAHEHPYVLGSAPLSPNGSITFDFSHLPQTIASTATGSLSEVRRHSEPANLAALQFAPFFGGAQNVDVPPAIAPLPTELMTLPITEDLASTSAAGPSSSHSAPLLPSSIAPHQTELPRPLELKHPKPVRGFKPPILLSGHHYDPKDFVRRRSEPVRPLPQLDLSSHLPLDVDLEAEEDEEESMEVEDVVYEDCDDDDDTECDDALDPSMFDEAGMEADRDMEALFNNMCHDGSLFNPNWSWTQGASGSMSAPSSTGDGYDWTLLGEPPHLASVPDMAGVPWDAVYASH